MPTISPITVTITQAEANACKAVWGESLTLAKANKELTKACKQGPDAGYDKVFMVANIGGLELNLRIDACQGKVGSKPVTEALKWSIEAEIGAYTDPENLVFWCFGAKLTETERQAKHKALSEALALIP